jgi:hypothetical protein
MIVLTKTVNNTKKLFILLILDIFLLLSILFKHYLGNGLWIFGLIIPIELFIVNIIVTLLYLIKYKNKIILLKYITIIICAILYFNNVDEKIALNIELKRAKNTLEKIIENNNIELKNGYISNGFFVYKFYSGMVDNWTAIIYDNSGFLENGINIINNNKNYLNSEKYNEIQNLFGGKLYYIKSLEENWFLCFFT